MSSAKKLIGLCEQLFDVVDYKQCKKIVGLRENDRHPTTVTYNSCDNECKIGCDFRRI